MFGTNCTAYIHLGNVAISKDRPFWIFVDPLKVTIGEAGIANLEDIAIGYIS